MNAPATVEVTTPRCVMCGESGTVVVAREAYDRWRAGEYIQTAMPEMPVDRREQLISGTHPACWDRMMGDGT